jgi:hypothetical protein
MHVWAGEKVGIEEKQLESEQMEGVEITGTSDLNICSAQSSFK